MLDLGKPSLDWQSIAQGMGVSASRAISAEQFAEQFETAMQIKGPHLIEAIVKSGVPKP